MLALRLWGWNYLRYPVVVVVVLLLLPLYRVGMFNDLTMRASIPALALVAIAASSALTETVSYKAIPLGVLMVLGCLTSVLEIIGRGQGGQVPAREVSLRSGFLSEDPRFSVQYRAPRPHWTIRDYSRSHAGAA